MIAKIKIVISLFLLFYYYQRTRTLAKVDIVIRPVGYFHSAPLFILSVGFIFPFRGLGNVDGFHLVHLPVQSGLGISQHPLLVIVFLVQEFQIVFQSVNGESCRIALTPALLIPTQKNHKQDKREDCYK